MYFGTEIVLQPLSSPFSFPATWHNLLKVLKHVITTPKYVRFLCRRKTVRYCMEGWLITHGNSGAPVTVWWRVVWWLYVHPHCIRDNVETECSTCTSEPIYPTWLIMFPRLSRLKRHVGWWVSLKCCYYRQHDIISSISINIVIPTKTSAYVNEFVSTLKVNATPYVWLRRAGCYW